MIDHRYGRLRSRTSRQARERIAGTVLRTPLVRSISGDGPDIWLKLENLQPTNAYKIRGAPMRSRAVRRSARGRVDDQRRQCRAGRRLCSAAVRHPLHRRCDRDRAADQARPHARARRDDRPGVLRAGVGGRGGTRSSRVWTAPSSTRSTITISSPATRPWASRSSRIARRAHRHLRRSAAAG